MSDILPDYVEEDETSQSKESSDVVDLPTLVNWGLLREEVSQYSSQDCGDTRLGYHQISMFGALRMSTDQ